MISHNHCMNENLSLLEVKYIARRLATKLRTGVLLELGKSSAFKARISVSRGMCYDEDMEFQRCIP